MNINSSNKSDLEKDIKIILKNEDKIKNNINIFSLFIEKNLIKEII